MQLAEFHYQVLNYLDKKPYTPGTYLEKVFPNKEERIEQTLKLLTDQKLIFYTVATDYLTYVEHEDLEVPQIQKLGFCIDWRFCLTELGHVCLESHEKEIGEYAIQKQELKLAQDTSKSAKVDAFYSKIISGIAILISFIALIHDLFF